jgi:hypothetical protein
VAVTVRGDRLTADQQLKIDDELVSQNGKVSLTLQEDGNLVLRRNDDGVALWASNTNGKPVTHVYMQSDGNLVAYDDQGRAYWATGTWTHPGAWSVLQDDGNFVLYAPSNGPALWATNTVTNWDPFTAETPDESPEGGLWMHSSASMAHNGLISGRLHVWNHMGVKGFHCSVLPVLAGGDGKAIWPTDINTFKYQTWVGGWLIGGPSDRTDPWAKTAPADVVALASSLHLINFYDPNPQLVADLKILGKLATDIAPLIAAITKGH